MINEWSALAYDLAHCRTLRALVTDEHAIETVDAVIADIQNRAAEIEIERDIDTVLTSTRR